MFKFDQVALPQLLIRKALVIVDFQQDFVGANGALPITLPEGYVDRTIRLAKAFRVVGEVIWVNSKFEVVRPPYGDFTENISSGHSEPDMTTDPEAFLSREEAKCVLSSKLGSELPQSVKEDAEKRDTLIWKSQYSAFEGTGLLRLLRAKMTMEIYICGSLVNIGVYATTVDAAGHGLKITLVEDCCGYSSETKHAKAIAALTALTGCDLISSTELAPNKPGISAEPSSRDTETGGAVSLGESIAQPMSALTLNATAPLGAEPATLQGLSDHETRDYKHKKDSDRRKVPHDDGGSAVAANLATMSRDPSETGDHASAGPEDKHIGGLCEGDTEVIENLLPPDVEKGIFEKLSKEVQWQRMSHQGGEVPRLVAVQGEVTADGSIPIYRHPSDESPPLLEFSPTVLVIKAETEKRLGHPLNHVLIQFYRDGKDYISEHSDKTLDIVLGSYIANVSLGAQRTMVLRTKRSDKDPSSAGQSASGASRKVQRAPLPHNSLCRMGLKTNMKWLHSIRQDKRPDREKSSEELAYEGSRISLTFRQIGTFLNKDETRIWGQGATGKTRDDANDVINGQTEESIEMLRAFGIENHSSNFDWKAHYGKGFDVLHLRSAPRFFASLDPIVNMRIRIMLAEYEIGYASGSIAQPTKPASQSLHANVMVKFVDNDDGRTEVIGDIAIMLYLHANHQKKKNTVTQRDLGKQFTLFQKALGLLSRWRGMLSVTEEGEPLLAAVKAELLPWESCSEDGVYIGGDRPNLADFALWPVLYSMVGKCGQEVLTELPALCSYYERMRNASSTMKVLGKMEESVVM